MHYCQVNIIEFRKKAGLIEGIKIKAKNPIEGIMMLKKITEDTLLEVMSQKDDLNTEKSKLLGLDIYLGFLRKLPLIEVEKLELATQKELKKRREIKRQYIDAGNIDKLIKKENE